MIKIIIAVHILVFPLCTQINSINLIFRVGSEGWTAPNFNYSYAKFHQVFMSNTKPSQRLHKIKPFHQSLTLSFIHVPTLTTDFRSFTTSRTHSPVYVITKAPLHKGETKPKKSLLALM